MAGGKSKLTVNPRFLRSSFVDTEKEAGKPEDTTPTLKITGADNNTVDVYETRRSNTGSGSGDSDGGKSGCCQIL